MIPKLELLRPNEVDRLRPRFARGSRPHASSSHFSSEDGNALEEKKASRVKITSRGWLAMSNPWAEREDSGWKSMFSVKHISLYIVKPFRREPLLGEQDPMIETLTISTLPLGSYSSSSSATARRRLR